MYFHDCRSASHGGVLCTCNNNDLNRLNCSMNDQDFINFCVFEQFHKLLFSDLSGMLRSELISPFSVDPD